MPISKLKKEFQMDDDDIAVVPVEDIKIRPSVLQEKVKRPISEKQRENLAKLVEANKVRWEKNKEEKARAVEAEKDRIRAELRAEVEAKIKAGTHVRVKVEKSGTGPKPKAQQKKAPVVSETETETETEADTTEAESDDDLPPRRVVRQARKQMRAIAKIDEVIKTASNPYMSKLLGRWN
tara:strand:- start:345 stop:884 length:540 start_codon:yes stop_codon:yes gene_type:complete